jgi:RNA polymerase sigma-70 factor, ECF subfamily
MRTFAAIHAPVPIASAGEPQAPSPPAEMVEIEPLVAGLFRFLRCLGASRELADDLLQEAFVVAWRKGKQALPERALASFLRRAARLLWLEHRRDARRTEAAISALALQVWETEITDDGGELVASARACVQRLRGRAAAAIDLAYARGSSREQIAKELGMAPNGVKTLLARTRAWLEQCIRRKS